jgi:hypothetical protein
MNSIVTPPISPIPVVIARSWYLKQDYKVVTTRLEVWVTMGQQWLDQGIYVPLATAFEALFIEEEIGFEARLLAAK